MADAAAAAAAVAAAAAAAPTPDSAFVADAHAVASGSHDFFAEVVPGTLLVAGVLAAFAAVAWVFTTIWAFCLRRCYVPDHWVRLTAYAWWLGLLAAGVWAAFGAAGIEPQHLFFGIGLFAIAFSAGCSSTIGNCAAGMTLQTHGLFANHSRVRLQGYGGITGRIVSMNLMHVIVEPDAAPAGPGAFAPHAVLVPNTVFCSTPVEVEWAHDRHPAYPAKPSRSLQTVAQKRAYAADKRRADDEPEVTSAAAAGLAASVVGGGGGGSSTTYTRHAPHVPGRFQSRGPGEPMSLVAERARQALTGGGGGGNSDLEAGRQLPIKPLLFPD